MRTAEKMLEYSRKNGYGGSGGVFLKGMDVKNFKVIEENLRDNEEVYMTFVGEKISDDEESGFYSFAVTNQRIMIGKHSMLGKRFMSIVFDRINDIQATTGALFGTVTFDTIGETFSVKAPNVRAENISKELHKVIFDMRERNNQTSEVAQFDKFEEIRKYKELVDEGIITEQEFDDKKKELLGIG